MVVIDKDTDPDFHRLISDTNGLRQYDFLRYAVEVALRNPTRPLSHQVLKQLNNHVVVFLCDTPGQYRQTPVYIKGSAHRPPDCRLVPGLMDEYLHYIGDHWNGDTIHLASYAMWRLNWIHPFVEGNGRTARAMCYYLMCVKYGFWLPGTVTIPKMIQGNRQPYYDALAAADEAYRADGKTIDLEKMEAYLTKLLSDQLSAAV